MKRFLGLTLAVLLALSCLMVGPAAVPVKAAGRQDPLPDHFVTGYWHNFCNGSTNIKLRDVPSYYDLVCIAFTENTAVGGRGTFSVDPDLAVALGGYTKEEMIQDIKLLQARGQHVVISVGGALGRISIRSEEEARNFADSMTGIIREYGLEGIDIDLEGGSVSATAYIASSLRTLHNTFGKDFIITMAPETAYIENEAGPYSKLLMEVKDILTCVFPQFYNTGCMTGFDGQMVNRGTADMMTSMSTTLIERCGLRDDQIAFGVPNTTKSSGSGFYSYAETKLAVNAFMNGTRANKFKAPRAYPGFRGMMAWSVNWDNTQNYKWAKSMSALMDEVSGYAPAGKPAVPSVKAEAGEERVKVSWNPVPGAESYEVYDAGTGVLLMNTSCNFYVVPHLENGKTYKFCVKASNAYGTSAASGVVSAVPEDKADVYPFYEDFKPTKEYKSGGTRVNYKGNVYENKYYTAGSAPDGNDAWKLIGPYLYNGDGFGNGGSAGNKPSTDPVKVTSVSLDKAEMTLEAGKFGALKATIAPANASDKTLTWKSSDEKVAAVVDGKIKALSEGTAVIQVITNDGRKTAECKVTVTAVKPVEAESVKLNKTSLTLEAGKSATLKATILPADAENKDLQWKTSDPSVATVRNGVVTAVDAGTAEITVSTANGKTAKCVVTVKAAETEPTVPETTAPETEPTVPETTKPVKPTVPETTAPETEPTVPETTRPEPTVPETTQPTPQPSGREWKTGVYYKLGTVVTRQGREYTCTFAHTSQADWAPGLPGTTTLWRENGKAEPTVPETTVPETTVPETTVPETTAPQPEPTVPETTAPAPTDPPVDPGVSQWEPNVSYKKGQLVSYQGKTYSCVQGHTSLGGWEPCNVPALWNAKN